MRGLPAGFRGLLREQHGAFTRAQAAACGVSLARIRTRVARAEWVRCYPGVFGVARMGRLGELAAGLLYSGPGAVLCGRSAAERNGLLPPGAGVEVTVPLARRVRPQPGLVVRRTGTLSEGDVWVRDGLATTRPERTLVDLARSGERPEVEALVCAALQRRLTTAERIEQAARRAGLLPRRPWFALLLADVRQGVEAPGELALMRLCRTSGLPPPRPQARLGHRRRGDLGWEELQVFVEVDSVLHHFSPADWQRDLARQNEVMADTGGVCLLRFTCRQIRDDPAGVVRVIRRALVAARQRRLKAG